MTDTQQPHHQARLDTDSPSRPRTRSNNPAWAADELILALELYLRQRGHIPSPRDADVVELSNFLNQLPIHTV